jgi:fatty acid desaturase
MHHPENNMEGDHSSTLHYQRDSFCDFMKYYTIFILLGIQQLYQYLTLKKKIKIRDAFTRGESTFWIVTFGLLFVNWQATLALFIIPVFLYRFLMMAGNWAQHAFIDKNAPENNYRNSITCINSGYNKKCWNDGYHIGHHLKQAMHWTELPLEFQKNINRYVEEKAIIFKKIDFFVVWIFLMLKRYDWLASFYVPLSEANRLDKQQIISLLKERTAKI